MSKFKDGDVVVLNSNPEGPMMTVHSCCDPVLEEVVCQWFNDKKLEQNSFKETSLQKVEREKKERLGPDIHLY